MNDANCGHADSCACLRPGDAACNCFLVYGFESQEAMDEHDAAIALMRGQSWKPIETAPRDGTPIIGWNDKYGARETYMRKFGEGSIGYANWKAGKGPAESGWEWHEPQSGWVSSWKPTHWSELHTPPKDSADEQ